MTQQFVPPGFDPAQAFGAGGGFPQPSQAPAYPQGYPQQPQAPAYQQPQSYGPQYGAPQGYGQQPYPQPEEDGTPVSLDDFYDQPSVGQGAALKIEDNQTVWGMVARDLINSDVDKDRDPKTGQIKRFRDGRPKLVMMVPLLVQPDQRHEDGKAVWYCRGAAKDELARAMAAAGAPAGAPEANAIIGITCTGRRSTGGGIPAKTWAIEYRRPDGAAQAPQQSAPVMSTATGQPQVHEQQVPQAPAAPQQYAPQPQAQQFAASGDADPWRAAPQALQQPQAQQFAPQAPQQPQAPAAPQGGVPEGMTEQQAQLFAKLTGQQPQG